MHTPLRRWYDRVVRMFFKTHHIFSLELKLSAMLSCLKKVNRTVGQSATTADVMPEEEQWSGSGSDIIDNDEEDSIDVHNDILGGLKLKAQGADFHFDDLGSVTDISMER